MAQERIRSKVMKETKLRYFYVLEYKKPGEFGSVFGLGWFSTKKNYLLKINNALKTPGFIDVQCFRVYKVGVKIPANQEKRGVCLYSISHEYSILKDGEYIDCFSYFDTLFTKKQAMKRVKFLRAHTRIGQKYPDGFVVDRIVVDDFSDWAEGFIEWDKTDLD